MTTLTALPSSVLVENIFPHINLQSVARVRSACKRFHDDENIKKYFSDQFSAAKAILCFDREKFWNMTNRQIKLVTHDWVKMAQEPFEFITLDRPSLKTKINEICGIDRTELKVPVRVGAPLKEIFKAVREYLDLPSNKILQLVLKCGECKCYIYDQFIPAKVDFSNSNKEYITYYYDSADSFEYFNALKAELGAHEEKN